MLDPRPVSAQAEGIAETARAQIGRSYRAGGRTEQGFDCSGLVQYCYARHGLVIPRTAAQQAEYGIRVCELRAGDILVFAPGLFSLHTGIYVGNGLFVHAPGKGRSVEICRLDARHWQKIFVGARRFPPKT